MDQLLKEGECQSRLPASVIILLVVFSFCHLKWAVRVMYRSKWAVSNRNVIEIDALQGKKK